jgi:tetratricopeptide (TPR) repeat protein
MKERKKILDQIIEEYPSRPKGWYHLAWWHRNDEPPNLDEGFKAFEEALKRDPFNARMVRAIRQAYNSNGDMDNVERLTERLTQIIPETAEDRHLLRINPGSRLGGLEAAFMRSGDRSLIDDDFAKDLTAFYNLNSSALRVRLQQGQTVEAERIARRLIDTSEMPELRQYIQSAYAREALTLANLVLGNQQKAKELAEVLVEQPGGPGDYYNVTGIRALSWIDTDRSADLALQKAKETPSWRGLDNLAAWHLLNPQFVIHPKIQSYYVKEGKWIEYLADHIPEYAAHKKK